MDQPLLTIGAFARAVGLAPSALRFYDECGLLRPAEVDEATGYRYYTPDLERRALAVAQMRDAGVSIETMRTALDGTAEERRSVLRDVLAEQESLAARRTAVLEDLIEEQADSGHDGGSAHVDGSHLAAAIRQVRAAAEVEPSSPLSSVLLDFTASTLDVVATNRYWMAVRTLPTSAVDDRRVVLALPDAAHLSALLDPHDHATLQLDETGIGVPGGHARARDVAYPAHRMVLTGLPPATTRVVVPRAELLSAIDAVGHAELDLTVSRDGVSVGDTTLAGVVDSPGVSLRLGTALARRAVECALGAEVVLRLASDAQPVRVTSPYQPDFLALLMPTARRGQ